MSFSSSSSSSRRLRPLLFRQTPAKFMPPDLAYSEPSSTRRARSWSTDHRQVCVSWPKTHHLWLNVIGHSVYDIKLVPWCAGKPMTWDVWSTAVITQGRLICWLGGSRRAASILVYRNLFQPIADESAILITSSAVDFLNGHRTSSSLGEKRELLYLFLCTYDTRSVLTAFFCVLFAMVRNSIFIPFVHSNSWKYWLLALAIYTIHRAIQI